MTEREIIAEAWETLEGFGYPPEAAVDETGAPNLANGISCALNCLIRQREDLLAEVIKLRASHGEGSEKTNG